MTTGQSPTHDKPPGEGSDSEASPAGADPLALARDWMTLVQTELAGLAADREVRETWQAMAAQGMAALWAQAARGFVPPVPPADDPPRAAAAAAAFGTGDAAGDGLALLLGRLDALERRIGELERAAGRPAPRRRGPAAG